MNKRILGGLAAAAMLAGGLAFTSAGTVSAGVVHCLAHTTNTKDQSGASSNGVVLAKDTIFCVKGSTGNSGVRTADGMTSLIGYMEKFAPRNGGGNVPDVSYFVVYGKTPPPPPPVQPDPTSRQTTSLDCASGKYSTVNYQTPFVFDEETDMWKPGAEVQSGTEVRDATATELAGAKCVTDTPPPPTPTPESEVAAIPPVAPAIRPEPAVQSASSPAQAPPAEVAALPPVAPTQALPSTGIDGTGVTALIALLLTSLGGAALFMSRRYNATN